jgi:hypothetical protein
MRSMRGGFIFRCVERETKLHRCMSREYKGEHGKVYTWTNSVPDSEAVTARRYTFCKGLNKSLRPHIERTKRTGARSQRRTEPWRTPGGTAENKPPHIERIERPSHLSTQSQGRYGSERGGINGHCGIYAFSESMCFIPFKWQRFCKGP